MPERILIIDDDDGSREALTSLLQVEGYETICAREGREGLEQLAQNPSLIICDLMMPIMEGWQFRAHQMQHRGYASIPFLVISAAPQPKIDAQAIFPKPVDVDALLACIQVHLADH